MLSCPNSFDIKMGDPILSSGADRGYQLVQLKSEGTTEYNGMICSGNDNFVSNFASVFCADMHGSDAHFAASFASNISVFPSNPKRLISNFECGSSSYTSLSQCTGTITPTSAQTHCQSKIGVVSCLMNNLTTTFSLLPETNNETVAGKGILAVAVSVTGQTTPGAVCAVGFDQTAALAACRSVGFTPGANAAFTTITSTTSHVINKVTCQSGANDLTDCKLQYSGAGHMLSNAAQQVCGSHVRLDCDVGAPTIEYRKSTSQYLQARLSPTAEWGWVQFGNGVSSSLAYTIFCTDAPNATNADDDDATIYKSFLTVADCPYNGTVPSNCSYSYTNGRALSRSFQCDPSLAQTNPTETQIPPPSGPPSNRTNQEAASAALSTGAVAGIAGGGAAIIIIILIVLIIICCCCIRRDPRKDAASSHTANKTNEAEEMEEHNAANNITNTYPAQPPNHSPAEVAQAPPTIPITNNNNNPPHYNTHHAQPPPSYSAANHNPQNQQQTAPLQYGGGGGGLYDQPVVGTAYPPPAGNDFYNGGAATGPPPPTVYALGMPAETTNHASSSPFHNPYGNTHNYQGDDGGGDCTSAPLPPPSYSGGKGLYD